jgi:N-acetylglutamate synthase-like GNAT family acetyltransferase
MNTYRIRRATSDDLQMLLTLWREAQMPALELEKRFTEFQVVEDEKGGLVAAIGLQIEGHIGRIHSETIADFSLADVVRPLLWQRFQTLVVNHGLYRLWTDETAPFWKKDAGFAEPSAKVRETLPTAFGAWHDKWLTLWLKDAPVFPEDIDKQFELFRQAGEAQRTRWTRSASVLNGVLLIGGALVFLLGIGLLIYVVRHSVY